MDYKFYFQQRFFSLIELGNLPDSIFASNIIVKDGTLGLSSHHSVHGNHNSNILISNIRMQQFDVAGFGCNGCTEIQILDCIIGSQNTNIPVLGRYTYARTLLPRIKDLVLMYGTEYMTFYGREPVLIADIADRIINEMDMIYNYYIKNY
eukprot:335075_1